MLVLGHVGRQLRSLQFHVSGNGVRLERVLNLCPDLSELRVCFFPNHALGVVSQLQPNTLKHLKKVSFELLQSDDYTCTRDCCCKFCVWHQSYAL
jgi:hypothetical protein